MAIGGFNNQGGNITLTQFKADVAKGEIHYYIAGRTGGGPGGGRRGPSRGSPADWAWRLRRPPRRLRRPPRRLGGPAAPVRAAHECDHDLGQGPLQAVTIGGQTVYDLTQPLSTSAITTWVKAHFKAVTIGGQTVYDLTQQLR